MTPKPSRIVVAQYYSRLGLFFPQLRDKVSVNLGFFIKNIFTAFDELININPGDILCNSSTFLELPLQAIFMQVQTDNWILRPRQIVFQVKHFLKYDNAVRCFRYIRPDESPPFPRVLMRLVRSVKTGDLRFSLPSLHHLLLQTTPPPQILLLTQDNSSYPRHGKDIIPRHSAKYFVI